MLYIVATPIGNLADITFRAVETLKEVDLIAAEDTRQSGILLKKYDITTQMISFHSYSDERKLNQIIDELRAGKSVALISDAGTPGISDPGYQLVKAAREAGVKVVPIPGPSAFLTALQASGLPTHHFYYLGFLPMKKGRQKMLQRLTEVEDTIVFYESPHRIGKTLNDLEAHFGERRIVIARELTKIYEEFLEGTAAELADVFEKRKPKGEFVVMIAPD